MTTRILSGDCRDVLKSLPDASVQCVVTSPPYYGLRSYLPDGHADKHCEIGAEATPDEYVAQLVAVFSEIRRVLRDDGTVWLVLGDSYASSPPGNKTIGVSAFSGLNGVNGTSGRYRETLAAGHATKRDTSKIAGIKPKDLLGIPWRVAFALQSDGWWMRSALPWLKRSCMPESCNDRPTNAIEYVFLLTKSPRYFWDAQAVAREGAIPAGTRAAKGSAERAKHANGRPPEYAVYTGTRNFRNSDLFFDSLEAPHGLICDADGNPLALDVNPAPFAGAHFAAFPPKLVDPLIRASTSERGCCAKCGAPWVRQTERVDQGWDGSKYGERAVAATGGAKSGGTAASTLGSGNGKLVGQTVTTGWAPSCGCDAPTTPCIVLDPFFGAGSTGLVCDRLGRDCIGIDLNPEYARMATDRITDDAPLFAQVQTS